MHTSESYSMSRTNRLLVRLLLLSIPISVIWVLAFLPSMYWSGRFDLSINISDFKNSVRAIRGATVGRVDEAKIAMQSGNRGTVELDFKQLVADPYHGGPLKIRGWQGGSYSTLGFEINHSQDEALVIVAQMADGSEVWKLVEIPEVRVSREVTVTLP